MNESQAYNPPGFQRSWIFQLLTIGVVLSLVLLPIIFNDGLAPERAQWKAARAKQLYRAGEKQTAVEMLTAATTNSDDPLLDIQLAQWHRDAKEYDTAIEVCDSILARYQVRREGGQVEATQMTQLSLNVVKQAIRLKAECLILTDQKDLAIQWVSDLGAFYNDEERIGEFRKNELAYFRAVCGKQLKQAEQDIGYAFRKLNEGAGMSFVGKVCFSIGLVSRYTDQQELAIEAITSRIEVLESRRELRAIEVNKSLYALMKRFVPLDPETYSKSNHAREQFERYVDELATLRAVKALLLEELERDEAASDERHRIAELGRDADAILRELPSDQVCLRLLGSGAQFLDTSGYVQAVQGENALALLELNMAVAASEILLSSSKTSLQNTTEMQDIEKNTEVARRTCAVIHNHRMQAYEAESCSELAKLERKRIVALGFEPGDDLF